MAHGSPVSFRRSSREVGLEYFDGLVRDNRFEGAPTGDPNGDGLDLRGSRVVVVNNALTGAADKAASVGEESEALFVSNHFGESISLL